MAKLSKILLNSILFAFIEGALIEGAQLSIGTSIFEASGYFGVWYLKNCITSMHYLRESTFWNISLIHR